VGKNKKANLAHKATTQGELAVGGSIESAFAQSFGPMLEQIRQQAMNAAMDAAREEVKKQAPRELSNAEILGDIREGERGPLRGPNSRYGEPGVRSRKRLADQGEEAKIWSGFMDRELVDRFKAKCKKYGVTQRRAMEWAMNYWVNMPGVGEREVKWKR
jgi:hypothetical protein